jgi:hypothetical protein
VPADVLVGTVRSPELVRATLTIGKEAHQRRVGDAVVIGFDDGSERRWIVETPHVTTTFDKKDQWEDLAAQPLARVFADVAPGDHVKCELEGWRIESGTRIAFTHDGDEVRIIAVVTRDDATAVDDVRQLLRERVARQQREAPAPMQVIGSPPTEPPPRKPWHRTIIFYGGLGLIGLVSAVATWSDPRALLAKRPDYPVAHALIVPSLFLLELALLLVMTRPWFEAVDTHQPRTRFRAAWSKGGLALGLMLGFILTDFCFSGPFLSWKPLLFGPLRLYALAAMSLLILILVMHGQRLERRLARLLRFGALRGTLIADSPPLVRDVRFDQGVRVLGQGDRERMQVWYDGVQTAGGVRSFALEINGTRMAVTGDRIFWGAPLAYVRLTDSEKSKGTVIAKTHAQISPGDGVLIKGRPTEVDGVSTFHATGAESFVMFGAPGNARTALTKLVLRWYAGAALILAIAIGSVAYGVHLANMAPESPKPQMPAERPY